MDETIRHFSHNEHELRPIDWTAEDLPCEMCNLTHNPGQKGGYVCFRCKFFIHKECAKFPQQINHHPLHSHHNLTLATRSKNPQTTCHYCNDSFEKYEYNYGCDQSCAFQMHMKCANIPIPTIREGGDSRVEFLCHGSSMERVEGERDSALCFACGGAVRSGPGYCCRNRECRNFFHGDCVDKLARKIEKHPFHTRHPLALRLGDYRLKCSSCCKRDCKLVFGCEGCEFRLCLDCVFLDTKVRCLSHDHDLYLVTRASCDVLCYACGKSYNNWPGPEVPDEVNRTRSCQFRCVECDFNLHFLCGPLPERVKFEYHVDVLSLVNHSVTEGHSNEYYCDVCEEEIKDTQFRVYYCEDCKYVAHVHCVFPEIMKMIKGNTMTENMKLKSLGEDRWELPIESHNTKQFTTLQDIHESLTKHEKEKLANPYYSSRSYRQKQYKHYWEQNSSRFYRQPSIFDNINVFQNLLSGNVDDILLEVMYYSPEEGLRLEERFLRQQVEDVNGYMVPKTLAHILYTLLSKHGDLGGDKSLSPGLKSVGATFLCIVVEEMCRIRAEDVTLHDIKRWYFCLSGIRQITGLRVIDTYNFGVFAVLMFLGFEATKLRHEVSEGLNKKISELKEEMKRCEESLEKLEIIENGNSTSSLMKECLKIAQEWKRKVLGDKWF